MRRTVNEKGKNTTDGKRKGTGNGPRKWNRNSKRKGDWNDKGKGIWKRKVVWIDKRILRTRKRVKQWILIKQNEEAKRTNKFLMENYSMLFNDLCYGF